MGHGWRVADARTSSLLALVPAFVLGGGCIQPPCEETYSPFVKVLVGLPIPMYITMGIAALLMLRINARLRRSRPLPKGGLAAVAATCVVLPIARLLPAHDAVAVAALMAYAMLLALVVISSLHKPGPDPKEQSWLACLSGELRPTIDDWLSAWVLAFALLFVTLIGSLFTASSVSNAGCEPMRRPPVGSPDTN